MTTAKPLKAPFPWPGGKARVADLVWSRLGNVQNYCEPFAGSVAVLLRRPADHFRGGYRVETVNDLSHFIVNFWRAVRAEPGRVAEHADWPVTEADLHARHKWLVRSKEAAEFRERMRTDPDHFDAKVAGWWCWGACCWIGSGWCSESGPDAAKRPHFQDANENGTGLGMGVHGAGPASHGRPQLADAFDIGRGVNGGGALSQQVPRLGARFGQMDSPGVLNPTHGTCAARREWLVGWMRALADRLRLVRTCYGHWSRVCDSESTLARLGTTGVFLDPPYPANRADTGAKSRDANLYATDKGADLDALRDEVLAWCVKWGGDRNIRVAVCGYEGDGYEPLVADHGWAEHAWEASGGYANQRRGGRGKAANAKRERIWFSPACINQAPDLFAGLEASA